MLTGSAGSDKNRWRRKDTLSRFRKEWKSSPEYSICRQWFNLNFMKRREYFLYTKKIKITTFITTFFTTITLLSVSPRQCNAILDFERKQRELFCIRLNTRMRILRCLRSIHNFQNGATLTRRDREKMNCCKKSFFLCVQNVFSSLHKIQIEPLTADGVFWRWFSEPRQRYLLGSQWDSHKPSGFYLKYLKLCSEDEQSFYGVGTTCG